ncbi:MAG: glycosyltransferase family 2 protein, partial [Thermogutta sp.]|uniref:glycosyltransferase family 2 protein n=1 Tax=Thermogutta sp. TaxID=1962930 RepID=UPI0019A97410
MPLSPLISVNMCVYRPHPVYFREAVQSILNQTFEDFELIIVEDPSEVDGREIISDLLSDKRIRYIHNEQRTGFCAQKNLAIQLSQGQYIAMMDADDISESNRLQLQFAHAEANPRIKVHGSALTIVDEEGRIIGFRKYPTEPEMVWKAM